MASNANGDDNVQESGVRKVRGVELGTLSNAPFFYFDIPHPVSARIKKSELNLALKAPLTTKDAKRPGILRTIDGVIKQGVVKESTIYTERYCLSPSRHKFVRLFWQKDLDIIATSLSEHNVSVQVSEGDNQEDAICATGSGEGLNLLMKYLQRLGGQVSCYTTTVDDPTILSIFTEEHIGKNLDILEQRSQCVLGRWEELNIVQVKMSNRCQSAGKKYCVGDMEILNSLKLSDNVALFLVHGDVTNAVVDIIVHETNKQMTNFIQISKLNEEKGDVTVTALDHCFCKYVIHAVSDIYTGGKRSEAQFLFQIVTKCLETADARSCTSIAIPAFGVRSNYPVTECTRQLVEAVKMYVNNRNQGKIKEICLCADKPEIIQQFSTSMQNVFPQAKSALLIPRQQITAAASESHSILQVINVQICDGDIAKQEADVIVNSTPCDLDLSNGSVSAAILAKGGPRLQAECRKKYPKGILIGEIARTSGHDLNCKEVFHVAMENFKHVGAKEGFLKIVRQCLEEASQSRYSSIAFPALGSGNLGYPHDVVSITMTKAFNDFQMSSTPTTLRDIKVVIWKDVKMTQEFESEIMKSRRQTVGNTLSTQLPPHTYSKSRNGRSDNITLNKRKCSVRENVKLHIYTEHADNVRKFLEYASKLAVLTGEDRAIEKITDPEKRHSALLEKDNQGKPQISQVKIQIPAHWTAQGPDKKVTRCPLLASDEEYKTVEKNFRASLGQTKINIVTIERIQNLGLHSHYILKKNEIENQNADIPGIPNERTLWHGTDSSAISNINHYGFDRSYRGKNATLYGEGTYFAVNSEYSTHPFYSPPDSNERRYIYQCKVLTGQAMKGKKGLNVLEPRSGVIKYDSATDSLEKPSLFVIFRDHHAYPEYLITFTNKHVDSIPSL